MEKLDCYKQTNIEITGDMKARFLYIIYTYCLEEKINVTNYHRIGSQK